MAYEASEIMTAVALQKTTAYLSKLKTVDELKFLIDDGKKNMNNLNIQFGDNGIKVGFLKNLDSSSYKRIEDMAIGVSAALATRKFISSSTGPITVYMTGNKWPKDVADFQVSAFGFKDYNSSDIVVRSGNKMTFYGISLKKKKTVKAPDPTLINKAFSTVFDGDAYDKLKIQLIETRKKYFAELVKEAVNKNILLEDDIENASGKSFKSLTTDELFNPKKTPEHKIIFKDKAYIDVKGWPYAKNNPTGYANASTGNPSSMRYFVNKKLSNKRSELWEDIRALMNVDADRLGEELINIILKVSLDKEIKEKNLKGKNFVFALMTGIAQIKNGIAIISEGKVFPLKTTLCGLDRLGFLKGPKYTVTELFRKNKAGDDNKAAKIFYQLNANLKGGPTPLLDLEIRYKGSFTPQPQFQGNMTNELKKAIVAECVE
jgi:hypothetical protein